ncbi:hypothetical protein FB451DRAFT_503867 [Mycena latifolia]|nr:hypothetical protein FB451DRAFT_503867 [Mycena latifolia]
MDACPPNLASVATPADLPGPIEKYAAAGPQSGILAYLDSRLEEQERMERRHQEQIDNLTRQIEQLNGRRYRFALRALLDEVINRIGFVLEVAPRKKTLVSGKTACQWDRDDVLRAWQAHLRTPKTITDQKTADYLADQPTVKMIFGMDGTGQEIREAGDTAAHDLDDQTVRNYCRSTVLSPVLREQLQKSFSFLFPNAEDLVFATI